MRVAEEAVRGASRRTWPVQVTEEMARGGHRGGGPWGVAEEMARGGSQRRWPVGGRGGGGPVHVTEVVRAGRGGGGPCRSRRRWSVQVAEENSFRNSESYRCFWFSLL